MNDKTGLLSQASGHRGPAITLACTLAIQAVGTGSTLAFPVLASVIPGVQPAAVGIFLAVVYLGAMIGSVVGAGIVNAIGPVRASQAALLLQGIALGLIAVGDPHLRLFAALLCGLGYGPITPASSQILARTTPPGRMGLAFSLKQTGVPLGGLFSGAALPLVATLFSWKAALAILAVLAVMVSLASNRLHALLDADATGKLSVSANWYRPITEVMAHTRLRSMAAVSLLFSACQLSVSGYLMTFLHREVGIGLPEAGVVYAVAQGAGIAGRLAWGHLADYTGSPRRVLLAISVLMVASAISTGLFTEQWAVPALCAVAAVFGATAIGWNGVFLGEVARLAPPGRVASVTGGALFFTYFGVVLGPPSFGYIAERANSLGFAYMVLGIAPTIAAVLLVWTRKSVSRCRLQSNEQR
jgi:MFS family permease